MLGTCERCSLVRGKKPDACKPKTTPAAPAPVEIREPTSSSTSSETEGAQSTPAGATSQPGMSSSPFLTNMPETVTVMSNLKASTDEDVNHPVDDVPHKSAVTDGETPEHVVTGASKLSPGPGVNFFLRLVPAAIFIMTVIFTVKLMWDHRKMLIYSKGLYPFCLINLTVESVQSKVKVRNITWKWHMTLPEQCKNQNGKGYVGNGFCQFLNSSQLS